MFDAMEGCWLSVEYIIMFTRVATKCSDVRSACRDLMADDMLPDTPNFGRFLVDFFAEDLNKLQVKEASFSSSIGWLFV